MGRVVALPRHKFVTGATLLQLGGATGSDVTGNDLTGSDRVRMRNRCFFITIVVVQNASLRMTDLGTGCDVPRRLP